MRTLITGASAGLGAGMAREFAARGHDLGLVARRLDRLEALRDELAPTGVRIAVAALAQCEAAMEIFRDQGSGHLVVVSSVAADRGLRGASTTYSATKAALSTLAEGIRADVAGTPVRVTTLAPGFISTDLNEGMRMPFAVDVVTGTRTMADAIERAPAPAPAYVPSWPWGLLGRLLRVMPMPIVRRLT